ncbi:MAG: TcpQ domain-containing protein [Enterobacterales bacterium]|nr:TcpQ domain-containing protein [Enterobacterales bacterium]
MTSHAELFIFTPEHSKNEIGIITEEVDRHLWYSPIRRSMPDLTHGDCMPIAQVASQLLPNDQWLLKLDSLEQKNCASWRTIDHQWYYILRAIDQQNKNLKIWINHDEQVIAWSNSLQIAKHLAHRDNRVWRLSSHLSLQKNLKNWTKLIDWQLMWQVPNDYPVLANSLFFGDIFDSMQQLINQINTQADALQGNKLRYTFDQQNKIIAISRSHKELR